MYSKLSAENKAKAPAAAEKRPDAKPAEDDKTVWKVPAGNGPAKGGAEGARWPRAVLGLPVSVLQAASSRP